MTAAFSECDPNDHVTSSLGMIQGFELPSLTSTFVIVLVMIGPAVAVSLSVEKNEGRRFEGERGGEERGKMGQRLSGGREGGKIEGGGESLSQL